MKKAFGITTAIMICAFGIHEPPRLHASVKTGEGKQDSLDHIHNCESLMHGGAHLILVYVIMFDTVYADSIVNMAPLYVVIPSNNGNPVVDKDNNQFFKYIPLFNAVSNTIATESVIEERKTSRSNERNAPKMLWGMPVTSELCTSLLFKQNE